MKWSLFRNEFIVYCTCFLRDYIPSEQENSIGPSFVKCVFSRYSSGQKASERWTSVNIVDEKFIDPIHEAIHTIQVFNRAMRRSIHRLQRPWRQQCTQVQALLASIISSPASRKMYIDVSLHATRTSLCLQNRPCSVVSLPRLI